MYTMQFAATLLVLHIRSSAFSMGIETFSDFRNLIYQEMGNDSCI